MANISAVARDLERAAAVIHKAKALIVTSGAGMGVDSGLPDFRGAEGFWRAYPPLRKLGLKLEEVSNPSWFDDDPEFAWGFFGHRYNLYSNARPHDGFRILLNWAKKMEHGYFSFTSNVDGHFQKAGFDGDRVMEVHGSIHFMQCINATRDSSIWPVAEGTIYDVDLETLRLRGILPRGPPGNATQLARPNILMFGDWGFENARTEQQRKNFERFKECLEDSDPFVIVEIGAGLAVPTVQLTSNQLATKKNATLIRINPNDTNVPAGHISLPMKGLEGLQEIDKYLQKLS